MELGGYHLIRRIAAGDTSTVYLVENRGVGGFMRKYAVKLPTLTVRHNPELQRQFLDDARLSANLSHPNVLSVRELGSDGDVFFSVIDLATGPSLADLRDLATDHIPADIAMHIGTQLATAIHSAYNTARTKRLGPIQCVVRPEHIFLDYNGIVRVAGFHAARPQPLDPAVCSATDYAYTAPEVRDGGIPDERSAQYLLALVLWELLAERRVAQGKTARELDAMFRNEGLRPVSSLSPHVPQEISDVLQRALSQDPAARFESLIEFEEALNDAGRPLGLDSGDAAAVVDYLGTEHLMDRFALEKRKYAEQHPITQQEIWGEGNAPRPRPLGPDIHVSESPDHGTSRGVLILVLGLVCGAIGAGAYYIHHKNSQQPPLVLPPIPKSTPAPPTTGAGAGGSSASSQGSAGTAHTAPMEGGSAGGVSLSDIVRDAAHKRAPQAPVPALPR